MSRWISLAPFTAVALALGGCTAEGAKSVPSDAASSSSAASSSGTSSPQGANTPPPEQPVGKSCGADQLKGWISAEPTADIKAQIANTVGQRVVRYYTDGDPVAMDYSEERLNVVLGENGRISQFRCG